ncbi:hypothetical protein FQN60_001193 [Etheostoma spectabile]|uniref:T-cell surface glycoprotein CD3 zeta chain n=1 Tax=Etheostoma spectabile TaxID=54343 RepID=A0A5J5D396_9PERO|nr:hypothetical protein FQN60_001193 [Etheostoma spectabile]
MWVLKVVRCFKVHTVNISVHWQVVSSATSSDHGKKRVRQEEQEIKTERKKSLFLQKRQKERRGGRVMYTLTTGVFVLFVLLVPVSSKGLFFSEPVICYYLDGVLVLYCIFATGLLFREKFYIPSVPRVAEDGGIYQELERLEDADPYQILEPSKAKKKAGKIKKPELTKAEDKDPSESLVPNGSDPPPP